MENNKNFLPPGFTPLANDDIYEAFYINMGPQHPSTHGALRLHVRLDGETVNEVVPHLGYIHRGIEKMGEGTTFVQYIQLTDRQDYLTSHINNMGVAMAIENAMDIGVPERAEYIRVILNELQRISSHLVFLGAYGTDLGGTTCFMYSFKEREFITDIFDDVCGSRLTMNYMRPGGVVKDVPDTFIPRIKEVLRRMEDYQKEWETFLTGNVIFQERNRGVGILPKDIAISYGCTGPVLRGSGIAHDVRRTNPYSIYDRFDFEIPIGNTGDCFDRYMVRVEEINQSLKILKQAISKFPEGDYSSKIRPSYRLPKGEFSSQIETAKGAYGTFFVAEKGDKPWRVKTRSPSFSNLQALNYMCKGYKIADLVTVLGTIDPVIPEVDR